MSPLSLSPSSLTRCVGFLHEFNDLCFDRTSDPIGGGICLDSEAMLIRCLFESPRNLMLFIDRGIDEAVWVGNTVVRVLEVRSGEVRLAISSPDGPRYQEVVLQCRSAQDDGVPDACDETLSFYA